MVAWLDSDLGPCRARLRGRHIGELESRENGFGSPPRSLTALEPSGHGTRCANNGGTILPFDPDEVIEDLRGRSLSSPVRCLARELVSVEFFLIP
jgi:hypothetical protein